MTYKIFAAIIFATFVCSCKTQKELDSVNGQLEQVKKNNAELAELNEKLKQEVNNLVAGNQSVNEEFSRYKTACEKDRKELAEMEADLDELDATMDAALEKVQKAMHDFEDKGVFVYRKDGLVYVSLEDDLLYKSGSSALGPNGKKALGSLAAALNEYPNLRVIVVGNTDDRLAKKGIDNWSLSTERANGVIRILKDEYKVDPSRLTAAGKGKYAPVADNSTETGRAKNRRTEIILNPDFNKIWEIARKEQESN